jgi:flagellar protein FliO/FliZ
MRRQFTPRPAFMVLASSATARRWLQAAALLAVAPPALAQQDAPSPLLRSALSGEQVSSYASGLLMVFAFLVVLVWVARWLQNRGTLGRGGLRVTASAALGGKERLVVVDVEGERLLVGVTPGGISLLKTLAAEDAPAQSPSPAAGAGGGWLERTLGVQPTRGKQASQGQQAAGGKQAFQDTERS